MGLVVAAVGAHEAIRQELRQAIVSKRLQLTCGSFNCFLLFFVGSFDVGFKRHSELRLCDGWATVIVDLTADQVCAGHIIILFQKTLTILKLRVTFDFTRSSHNETRK